MSYRKTSLLCLFCVLGMFVLARASTAKNDSSKDAAASIARGGNADNQRVQGEQRFHANCGRCHAAPQKFPPRMMATVLRHMRVRATITDEDRRLILLYMTQ
jgi:cytochrome c5